jgi:hypothetical protein
VLATDEGCAAWQQRGTFALELSDAKGNARPAAELADALAAGVLDNLVRVELAPGPRIKGKPTHKVRIDNNSPLVLGGLALAGAAADPEASPALLLGISLPPQKRLFVPASTKVVERLKLTQGIRVLAAGLAEL